MISRVFEWGSYGFLIYLLIYSLATSLLTMLGWFGVNDYVRRRPLRSYRDVASSELSMPVSILVPCFNEEATIVGSLRSLLASKSSRFEILVINDGSDDGTAQVLLKHFDMVPVCRSPSSGLTTKSVLDVHVSRTESKLILIDKENGGKADALNAGINYARYPLICSLDADTLVDPWALARLVWEFQAHPDAVGVGGIVRVLNGSRLRDGKLVEVATPRSLIPNLQIVEYLRAFLGARIGWSRTGMLLIISGAFGLFRKSAVLEAGGYDPTTVGEDAELVLRLHRSRADAGLGCRIVFFPDPICWTEVPSTMKVLSRQRDRWQRGLIQMLWRHRGMLLRRKYRQVGMIALPYFWIFEMLGPAVEIAGYVLACLGLVLGLVWRPFALLLLVLCTVYGVLISIAVILMEERAFARYPGWKDLSRLIVASVVENFWYRQYLAWVRLKAFWHIRRRTSWGEMSRAGFGDSDGDS